MTGLSQRGSPFISIDSSNVTSYTMSNNLIAAQAAKNSLVIVMVIAYATVDAGAHSQSGLTWTPIGTFATPVTGTTSCYAWYTMLPGDWTGGVGGTFTCTSDAATGITAQVFQFVGYNKANPIAQFKMGFGTTTTTPSIVFPGSLNTNNAYCYLLVNTSVVTATEPANWTQISQNNSMTSPAIGAQSAYRIGGESGTTISPTFGLTSPYQYIAAEVNIDSIGYDPAKSCLIGVSGI